MAGNEQVDPGLRIAPYVQPPGHPADGLVGDAVAGSPPFVGAGPDPGWSAPPPGPPSWDGPVTLQTDSWDLPEGEPSNETYRGVRRAGAPRSWWRVGALAAAVAVGTAVALRLILLAGGSEAPAGGAGAAPTGAGGSSGDAVTLVSPPVSSATVASSAPASPAAAAGPILASYEAEAGPPDTKLRGPAQVVAVAGASGGQVVRGLGNWGQSGTASIQFRGVTVPADGTYVIAITYVPDATSAGRTAVLDVGPVTVTATFAAGSGCCAVTTVAVVLTAGTHLITMANESSGVPPIDKITISRG